MTKLDQRGIISVIEIIVYVPVLSISIFLFKRHGFTKRAGWIFLVLLSLIRIIGGATHIASEESSTPNITLHIVYGIMEASGVSPLMLATLGFLATIAQEGLDHNVVVIRGLRLLGLLDAVALTLTIAGGAIIGSGSDPSQVTKGSNVKHIGVILFVVQYGLVTSMHGFYWMNRDLIMKHRRMLLLGISCALPFLGVRILYSILSGYAPFVTPGSPPSDSSLAKFGSTGDWGIYLVMSVITEIIVVAIYTFVGMTVPLSNDYAEGRLARGWNDDDEELERMKP